MNARDHPMNPQNHDLCVANTNDEERLLAFKKIEKAVRDSNIWQAAWYMGKFLKRSYTLTRHELKWLQEEHMDRVKQLEEAVTELQKMAVNHAEEDFRDWLENGVPFLLVENASKRKHYHNPDIDHVLQMITTYSRAAAYMKCIIEMRHTLAGLPIVEEKNEGMELEAMGACPDVEAYKKLTLEDVDWEFIEKNEAMEPLTQWTVIRKNGAGTTHVDLIKPLRKCKVVPLAVSDHPLAPQKPWIEHHASAIPTGKQTVVETCPNTAQKAKDTRWNENAGLVSDSTKIDRKRDVQQDVGLI